MKSISATTLVALMTATIGLTAMTPAFAQDAAPAAAPDTAQVEQAQHMGPRPPGLRQRGLGDFLGVERGAEAIEVAFVRLAYAVEPTPAQQPLFDAFRDAALAAANDFASATEGLRPALPAPGEVPPRPDFTAALDARIAFDTARLAALQAIQPSATAFFDSLTDEQVSALMPGMAGRDGGPGFGKGPRELQGHHQGNRPGPRPAPGATAPAKS